MSSRNISYRANGVEYRFSAGSFTPAMMDTKRNLYTEFGYSEQLTFDDWWTAYRRTFGSAIVEIIPNGCWMTHPTVKEEGSDGKTTPFEREFSALAKRVKLWSVMHELHTKSRVGEYGALLITAKELTQTNANDPMVLNGADAIVRIVAHYQDAVSDEGVTTETNLASQRYGMPLYYNYRENVVTNKRSDNAVDMSVHWSRVFTFSESAGVGCTRGNSVLEPGYNYIQNIEKILGGTGEGYFKNAANRTYLKINDKETAMNLTNKEAREKFDDRQRAFDSGQDTARVLYGVEPVRLAHTIMDPEGPFRTNLNALCATCDQVPGTLIVGHQTGERASAEDMQKFWSICDSKRRNVLDDKMILAFIDHLFTVGGLRNRPTSELCVDWQPLSEPSEKDKLANMKTKYEINKIAMDARMEQPFPDVNENRKDAGFVELDNENTLIITE